MSARIETASATGQVIYAVVRNSDGAVWNVSVFETYNAAHWSLYALAMTEQGVSGYYSVAFPSTIIAGRYTFVVYAQAGASPSVTADEVIGSGSIFWDGIAVVEGLPQGSVDETIALITLVDAKLYLKVATGTTTENTIISDLINECSVWINSYCGRQFIAPVSAITEYYDGDGTKDLFLKQWPVISLTSLYMDYLRVWESDTAIDVDNDVQLDSASGIITLWNNQTIYSNGQGNVRVIYRAGYLHDSSVPYDLQMACRKLVAWKYFQDYSQRRFGVASESTGDRQVNFTDEALLPDVKQILDRYRRLGAR